MADKKKEGNIEEMINYLHKNYISLRDEDMKTYNDHFRKVLLQLVTLMKMEDPLFNVIFREICGAGSYYDGLKVGKPEEFDMDVVISLPVNYKEITINNTGEDAIPAFTKIQMKDAMVKLRQHPNWTEVYRHMDSWCDENGYLLQTKFRQWIEGVVNKALNKLKLVDANKYELIVKDPGDDEKETKYRISLKKSGPAMTFFIEIPPDGVRVDVDFVPVIEFVHPQWPPHHVRQLPRNIMRKERTKWFIVPKPKKNNDADGTLWRLAFHDQEREILSDRGILKPVCRMLKMFREKNGLKIASYYLKTLFLWEIDAHPEREFWKKKQSEMFLYMLDKLMERLQAGKIPYYWDERYDLLDGLLPVTKSQLANTIRRIKADIEKKMEEDPRIFAKHLLPKKEYEFVMENYIPPSSQTPSKPHSTPVSPKPSANGTPPKNSATAEVELQPQSNGNNATSTKSTNEFSTVMNILMQLTEKIEKLENRISELCDENRNLRDDVLLCMRIMKNGKSEGQVANDFQLSTSLFAGDSPSSMVGIFDCNGGSAL